ncbi:very-long-chain (3R)-3-hydroxyacyl-CoA dehydratase [Condylostylus longicornis]|uniref:very-long-chain (3R)-3-hydroxyacyl-CoA dehydratase n=1 Tax=Condylostylus longicornis TaxID=2530218 RepID=UPI00244E185F|nr:very-long-chain (3R)-3-hydroxyacyl-CoA dehydratase [Condylostylus longicornis]
MMLTNSANTVGTTKNQKQTQQLSPFVYWAQTEDLITLKVDLKEVEHVDVTMENDILHFEANGLGARGVNDYEFNLHFFSDIEPNDSTYNVHDTRVTFNIKKKVNCWWPRLICQPLKPHWLRIDFDKWKTEDDIDLEEPIRNIMQDYPNTYKELQRQEFGYIKEKGKMVYLLFYNFGMFIGYLYIFSVMSILYYRDGINCMPNIYENVGNAYKFVQLMQYLEVLHPIFNYTKGSALIPFLQVTGRNFILFIMIDNEIRMQTKPVVFYLFIIWTLIELFRYPYYITQLLNINIYILKYLRYTLWIPLYPLGIVCEGVIILRNVPYFEETQKFCVNLPNKFNFTFDMPLFLKIYLLILALPGTYFLISHMTKAREKKLKTKKKFFL